MALNNDILLPLVLTKSYFYTVSLIHYSLKGNFLLLKGNPPYSHKIATETTWKLSDNCAADLIDKILVNTCWQSEQYSIKSCSTAYA